MGTAIITVVLENVIADDVKQIALGHCIVQASRPRSIISPITSGVGVSVDYQTSKPCVVQLLSRLGLSVSPDEVNRYKQSVTQSFEANMPSGSPAMFTQWAADNADNNINTLDGQGTFHGMSIISMSVCNKTADLVASGSFTG